MSAHVRAFVVQARRACHTEHTRAEPVEGVAVSHLASGKLNPEGPFDLREDWLALLLFAAQEDDEGSDDGDGDGTGGDGSDSGDGDDDSGGTGDEEAKNPRIKELSDENAKWRNNHKAEKARADALQKQIDEAEDSKKSKEELLEKQIKEATEENKSLKKDVADLNLRVSFYESGAAAQLQDPGDALKFLDLKELTPDEDGKYKDKEVLAAVEGLIKKKPYLAKKSDDDDGDSGSGNPSGRRMNGKRGSQQELDRQRLEEKFPALRGRS